MKNVTPFLKKLFLIARTHPKAFLCFFMIMLTVFSILFFDQGVAYLFSGFSERKIGYFFKAISQVASFKFWLPVLCIIWFCYIAAAGFARSADSFYFFMTRARKTLYILCSFLVASGVCQMLRLIVTRYDPKDAMMLALSRAQDMDPTFDAVSFPSLHAALATAILYSFMMVSARFRPGCLLILFLISFSRIVIERNYLSDILFGMFIGSFTAILLYPKFKKFLKEYEQ